ncbi:MAG: hypothetical protein JST00_16140 [Deltaproteobacteria bacterium]|nr:hypothetical protein [Deltaproteobacteria bacterium]
MKGVAGLLGVVAGCAAGAFAACSSFEAEPERDADAAVVADAATASDASPPLDAPPGDAPTAPCLPPPVSFVPDSGLPPPPGWFFSGEAKAQSSFVVLTTENGSRAGAVFWDKRIDLRDGELAIRFFFQLVDAPPPAEGFAVVWLSGGSVPPSVGPGGNQLGILQRTGAALVLDTSSAAVGDGGLDPLGTPFFAVATTSRRPPLWFSGAKATAIDGAWHELNVLLSGKTITAEIDGSPTIQANAPEDMPKLGYLGFTAATGTNATEHRIRDVQVRGMNVGCATP